MSAIVSVKSNVWYNRLFNKLFTSDNYYKSMQAMFFLTFIYGVTPFRVVTSKCGCKSLKTSYFGYINALLHVCAMAFCYAYTMHYNESVAGYFLSNNISKLGNKLYVFSGIIGATVVFVSALIRTKILQRCFNILLETDECFKGIAYSIDYTLILRFVIFVLSAVVLFVGTLTVICIYCLKSMNVYPSPCLIVIVVAEFLTIDRYR